MNGLVAQTCNYRIIGGDIEKKIIVELSRSIVDLLREQSGLQKAKNMAIYDR
jgi:hypothetical protein